MADEAFALSPISARAAQPSEEDYAAISEAFMETSRGRWFLGEYAKRNRNADTRLVLDAVARIEQSIAAQKQSAADTTLADALAAIRAAVGEAQASVTAALEDLALDQHLSAVRKGARVRIIRADIVVLELGTLQTLKRFKDEVNEVNAGQECGMFFQGFQDIKEGDTIECFSLEEVKRSL